MVLKIACDKKAIRLYEKNIMIINIWHPGKIKMIKELKKRPTKMGLVGFGGPDLGLY